MDAPGAAACSQGGGADRSQPDGRGGGGSRWPRRGDRLPPPGRRAARGGAGAAQGRGKGPRGDAVRFAGALRAFRADPPMHRGDPALRSSQGRRRDARSQPAEPRAGAADPACPWGERHGWHPGKGGARLEPRFYDPHEVPAAVCHGQDRAVPGRQDRHAPGRLALDLRPGGPRVGASAPGGIGRGSRWDRDGAEG